ncbi:MAG: NAD-dependent epimerase/dehydratase family protein [Saprospiraceae bacterium]|nr:NAD-dependent epimerase/dehydratase family protein [Saprospiraceae bacterium]
MFKKILVTGGSGFIGYHLHNYLAHERIVNLDLEEPDFAYHSTFFKGDVRDPKIVAEALKGCDAIWNMAAAHKDFGISRDEYFDINEQGMRVMTQAATIAGVKKFVFFSSVAVYGDSNEAQSEDSIPSPSNDYGASKLAAERVLEQWASEDSRREILIIRPVLVYGERNFGNMHRLMKQIDKGHYVHIGKGQNVKSVAYVKNLIEAVLYLLYHLNSGVSVYNYADEPQMTSHDIGKTIASALTKKPLMTLPYWLVYGLALPFDCIKKITGIDLAVSSLRIQKLTIPTHFKAEKIKKMGFKPPFSNIEGLENMAKWFKETRQ